MPLFDSLNLMFLGAVAVFADGITRTQPGPSPTRLGVRPVAGEEREKVSHEQSSAAPHRSARAGATMSSDGGEDATDPAVSVCPTDDAARARSRRDPSYVAEAPLRPSSASDRPPLTRVSSLSISPAGCHRGCRGGKGEEGARFILISYPLIPAAHADASRRVAAPGPIPRVHRVDRLTPDPHRSIFAGQKGQEVIDLQGGEWGRLATFFSTGPQSFDTQTRV